MSEHSSKRQRLTGSFSPASPPYHIAAKTAADQTKPIIHPNTPTSPPYTSMNSLAHGGSGTTATVPPAEMTPPSSVHMSQQASQSGPSATNPHPFPTPASTTGGTFGTNIDSDGDALMEDDVFNGASGSRAQRHSNHNRQNGAILSEHGGVVDAEGVFGDKLFMRCHNPSNNGSSPTFQMSRPHVSQNLFDLYGLDSLARSVARNDPVTGEKINKLRKSYEGHIKAMQIAGKPKAVKMDAVFSGPLTVPDEEWHIMKVQGKEVQKALGPDQTSLDSEFNSLLDGAFAGMAPGPLPPTDAGRFKAYLGTDDTSKSKPADPIPQRAPQSAAATPNPHAQAVSRPARPERSGAKRNYHDMSYAGYGEGFADDFGADSPAEDSTHPKKRKLGFERASHSVEVGGVRR